MPRHDRRSPLRRLLCVLAIATPTPACAARPQASPPVAPVRATAAQPTSDVVLFVLTAADRQTLARGKVRDTGYFLGEFYEAHRAVTAAGFRVAIATPGGRAAPVDPESLDPKYWEAHPAWLAEAKSFVATDPEVRSPMTLDAALAAEQRFAGLVVPGGQGVMTDLVGNPTLHALVERFAETERPIGLICHAPALLFQLPGDAHALRGREVTSVSGFEEFYIESFVMHGRARERGIGKRLRKAGFAHVVAGPGKPFATRDRNLVTSQNPFSGDAFARHFTAALAQWRDAQATADATPI